MAWIPGQQLQDGKYRIEKVLGEGGFGITYLAISQDYGLVVIKTLNDDKQKSPDFDAIQNRFLKEPLAIRGCQHPHIVRVYGHFYETVYRPNSMQTKANELRLDCIVMEYVQGINLQQRLDDNGALPEWEALRYVGQIGGALTVVHGQRLLHRDVTPSNIMVRQQTGEAVLIDFGLAREFTAYSTQRHTNVLSKGYGPLEQYFEKVKRGEFTDVYGLAATLYSLVTGEVPVSASDRYYGVTSQDNDPLVLPQTLNPDLSDRTATAILKGMAIQPKDRPQSIADWLGGLNISPEDYSHHGVIRTHGWTATSTGRRPSPFSAAPTDVVAPGINHRPDFSGMEPQSSAPNLSSSGQPRVALSGDYIQLWHTGKWVGLTTAIKNSKP